MEGGAEMLAHLANLQHPNIVRHLWAYPESKLVSMCMDYLSVTGNYFTFLFVVLVLFLCEQMI